MTHGQTLDLSGRYQAQCAQIGLAPLQQRRWHGTADPATVPLPQIRFGGNNPEADGAKARIYAGDSTLARRDVQSRPTTSPPKPGGTDGRLPADQQ
jgi:hypothetical protein